ncbi:MAG: hypothetical protein HQL32_13150, partial [Planctomycetes bacterium]|nr:hypothetical protein [Planctomycetota bacterium]
MNINIIDPRGSEKKHELQRLVSTLGFGEECDISLGPSQTPIRFGMFIKQGDGINFKPLNENTPILFNQKPITHMVSLCHGDVFEFEGYQLYCLDESQDRKLNTPAPPTQHSYIKKDSPAFTTPPRNPYRAGAINAYGAAQAQPARSNTEEISALSSHSLQGRTAQEQQPEPTRSEEESSLSLQLGKDNSERKPEVSASQNLLLRKKEISLDMQKNILKHFFNHLELKQFDDSRAARDSVLKKGLNAAINELVGENDDNQGAYDKLSKELKSPAPLADLLTQPEVQEVKALGSGQVFIHRGRGYGNAELSFFNKNHLLWSLDRLFISKGTTLNLEEEYIDVLFNDEWRINGYIPHNDSVLCLNFTKSKNHKSLQAYLDDGQITSSHVNTIQKAMSDKMNILITGPESKCSSFLMALAGLTKEYEYSFFFHNNKNNTLEPNAIGISSQGFSSDFQSWAKASPDFTYHSVYPNEGVNEIIQNLSFHKRGWHQYFGEINDEYFIEHLSLKLMQESPNYNHEFCQKMLSSCFSYHISVGDKINIRDIKQVIRS